MRLARIAETSTQLAKTTRRLQKIALLAQTLSDLSPDEIGIGVNYLTGALPQGRIGLGESAVREMRSAAAAEEASLRLVDVDARFARIAKTKGAGSAAERRGELAALFALATREEQAFLARLLTGVLRQGALEGVMMEAIARAVGVPVSEVLRAVTVVGDLPRVARAALAEGSAGLAQFAMSVLAPLKPMLAQPAAGVEEALAAFGCASFEYKLDGARVQVHKQGSEVQVFTRALNDVTAAVPEIREAVTRLPSQSLILDGEAIALRADGTPQPFQETLRRFGRKLDVESLRRAFPLSVFFFDVLHADGADLIALPARRRFEALGALLPRELLVPRLITNEASAAEAFLRQALAHGHEGVMAKSLEAPYEAGNRGRSWLKIKLAHTLDLVVLAAEWGSGRRRDWLSNLHLGAREPETGTFVMLGKTFKGMTDEMLAWQTQKLVEMQIATEGATVHVRPALVVEVAFNDIQASPQYPGGMALRFARVKRYRPDKRPQDADTLATVRRLFEQKRRAGG